MVTWYCLVCCSVIGWLCSQIGTLYIDLDGLFWGVVHTMECITKRYEIDDLWRYGFGPTRGLSSLKTALRAPQGILWAGRVSVCFVLPI